MQVFVLLVMKDIVAMEIMVYVYCVMIVHVKLMILLIGLALKMILESVQVVTKVIVQTVTKGNVVVKTKGNVLLEMLDLVLTATKVLA